MGCYSRKVFKLLKNDMQTSAVVSAFQRIQYESHGPPDEVLKIVPQNEPLGKGTADSESWAQIWENARSKFASFSSYKISTDVQRSKDKEQLDLDFLWRHRGQGVTGHGNVPDRGFQESRPSTDANASDGASLNTLSMPPDSQVTVNWLAVIPVLSLLWKMTECPLPPHKEGRILLLHFHMLPPQ